MTDTNDTQHENRTFFVGPQAMQVNIKMQHGERTGQPLYSNFASVQAGQGAIIVDFGFLDPQIIQALNRLARSGEKMPDSVNARLSCRMAMSVESANNLSQQLNQLLQKKT